MCLRFRKMLSVACAALLPCGSAVCAAPAALPGGEYSLGAPAAEQTDSTAINIRALHASLPGSELVDAGLLVFSLSGYEVFVLADEHEAVRFMLVRSLKPDAKPRKKDPTLKDVCQQLRDCFDKPECRWAEVLRDDEAKVALVCYAPLRASEHALGKDRVAAIPALMQAHSVRGEKLRLTLTPGYSLAFLVQKEGVLFSLALDLSQPTVEYAELRCVDLSKKDRDTKYTEVAATLWPGLSFSGKKGSVGGKVEYKILGEGDGFLMARKDTFFVFASEELVRRAAAKGVNAKKYGFEREESGEHAVTLPAPDEVDWTALTLSTGLEDDFSEEDTPEEETPEEDTPEEDTPTPADDAAQDEPQQDPTPAEDAPPQQPAPAAAEPYTPEAARRAFIEQLRNL